jgi:hypothetical protein
MRLIVTKSPLIGAVIIFNAMANSLSNKVSFAICGATLL